MGLLDSIEADPDAVAEGLLDAGFVVAGTPDDVVPVLDTFREVGVDQVIFHMQMGGVPHDDIMRSIEVMGAEVIPRYA